MSFISTYLNETDLLSAKITERAQQDQELLERGVSRPPFGVVISQSSREVNNLLFSPQKTLEKRIVCRQNTPLGESNISPSGDRVRHADLLPVVFGRAVLSPDYLDNTPTSFAGLCLSKPVTIVTEHDGKELAIPSFITSVDPETRTFCVHNPSLIYSLRSGDSGARVLLDHSSKHSSEAGLVNALAKGENYELRCVRADSKFSIDTFPDDIEIFKYQRLSKERLDELEGKIRNINDLKIKSKTKIGTWEATGNYNWDLRNSGLDPSEQLSYAGHLVFQVYRDIVDSLSSKNQHVDYPEQITGFETVSEARSIIGKTSTVDASYTLTIPRKARLKLEINADDPALQAMCAEKGVDDIQGPPFPHVGGMVTSLGSGKSKLATIHVLVSQVDATRIKA